MKEINLVLGGHARLMANPALELTQSNPRP